MAHAPMLSLSVGHSSLIGTRSENEDFGGIVTPEGEQLLAKGGVLALADGVGGGERGREAAEATVRGLLSDYYATPDAWAVHYALDKVLTAINSWVHARGRSVHGSVGMATTLSALVLRGRRWYSAHLGDTRLYLLRAGKLTQLTTDHVWDLPEMSHVLKRAIGLDEHLVVDFSEGELQEGDVFLLACDGVWEPLGDARMARLLSLVPSPEEAAASLTAAAVEAGGQDNATALVVRVEGLPAEDFNDFQAQSRRLPLPPRLVTGAQLDDFHVLDLLHESRATLLYRVRHAETGQILVLKTLQPLFADDRVACSGLLAEEWLAKRVVHGAFAQVIPLSAERRNFLYYVMTWHAGATLEEQLEHGRHLSAPGVAALGVELAKAMAALHRLHIIHRDIKPANLHRGEDGRLRLLDLGVAMESGGEPPASNAGTPSFMAPELFSGRAADVQADIYAAGVTLYHTLTRRYPYGPVEAFQHPEFGEPTPPTRYRPDVPQWLENVLLRAVAREPKQRFETAEEFLLALERGDFRPVSAPTRGSLAQRRPLALWRGVALVSVVVNLVLVFVLLAARWH